MNVTIKHIDPTLSNPEDLFNDLISDGYSTHEALHELMKDAILEDRLRQWYPEYTPTYSEWSDTSCKVELEKIEDEGDEDVLGGVDFSDSLDLLDNLSL